MMSALSKCNCQHFLFHSKGPPLPLHESTFMVKYMQEVMSNRSLKHQTELSTAKEQNRKLFLMGTSYI